MGKSENSCLARSKNNEQQPSIFTEELTAQTIIEDENIYPQVERENATGLLADELCLSQFRPSPENDAANSEILQVLRQEFTPGDFVKLLTPHNFEEVMSSGKRLEINSDGKNVDSTSRDENAKCAERKPLTEKERIAERNRKGRERSLRTRRRNADRLKNLEYNCTYLDMENNLLEKLIHSLRGDNSPEEVVLHIKSILDFQSSKEQAHQYTVEEGRASRSLRQSGSEVEQYVIDPALKRASLAETGDTKSTFLNSGNAEWPYESEKEEECLRILGSQSKSSPIEDSAVQKTLPPDKTQKDCSSNEDNTKRSGMNETAEDLMNYVGGNEEQIEFGLCDDRKLPLVDSEELAELLNLTR